MANNSSSRQLLRKLQHLIHLFRREPTVHRIRAKIGERRFIQINSFESAFLNNHVLHHAHKIDLVGVVFVLRDERLKHSLHDLGVIGQRIQSKHRAHKREQTAYL